MKKVLIGSTALVAACIGVWLCLRRSERQDQRFVAAEAILNLSDTRSESFNRDYDFATNARLIFDVKNVTDSGLEYGARVRSTPSTATTA